MNRPSWQFAALEFTTLWQAAGRDVLPYPAQRGPGITVREDYDRARMAAAEKMHAQLDERLLRALQILAFPEIRVEVAGFAGLNQDRKIRVHAAFHHDAAAVLVQQPGADHKHGGDIELTLCRAQNAPGRIVAALPPALAGKEKPLSIYQADLEPNESGPVLRGARDVSVRERVDKFLKRPRTSFGHVDVLPGGAVDNRQTDRGLEFGWQDFQGDGRYLMRSGKILTAEPVDANGLAGHIQRLVTLLSQKQRAAADA
jgi:hypothetical protein